MFIGGGSVNLVRFELAFEDAPMEIGFIVGLPDIGTSEKTAKRLLSSFDRLLTIPAYSCFDSLLGHHAVSYFTPEGLDCFRADIENILRYIRKKDCGYSVIRKQKEIPENSALILYQDRYQVIISEPWRKPALS